MMGEASGLGAMGEPWLAPLHSGGGNLMIELGTGGSLPRTVTRLSRRRDLSFEFTADGWVSFVSESFRPETGEEMER